MQPCMQGNQPASIRLYTCGFNLLIKNMYVGVDQIRCLAFLNFEMNATPLSIPPLPALSPWISVQTGFRHMAEEANSGKKKKPS